MKNKYAKEYLTITETLQIEEVIRDVEINFKSLMF